MQYSTVDGIRVVRGCGGRLQTTTGVAHRTVSGLSLSAPLPSGLSVNVLDFQFRSGDRVIVQGKKIGTVRYVGRIEGTSGTWFGIEYDKTGDGNCDGTYLGHRLFTCALNTGIFVRIEALQYAPDTMSGGEESNLGQLSEQQFVNQSVAASRNGSGGNRDAFVRRSTTAPGGSLLLTKPNRYVRPSYLNVNPVSINVIPISPNKVGSFRDGFAAATAAAAASNATTPRSGAADGATFSMKRHHTMPPGIKFGSTEFSGKPDFKSGGAGGSSLMLPPSLMHSTSDAGADGKSANNKPPVSVHPPNNSQIAAAAAIVAAAVASGAPANGVHTQRSMMAHLSIAPPVRVHGYHPDDPPTPAARENAKTQQSSTPADAKKNVQSATPATAQAAASNPGATPPVRPRPILTHKDSMINLAAKTKAHNEKKLLQSSSGAKPHAVLDPKIRAIIRIQAIARGKAVRNKMKDHRLFKAWSELDWREEQDLMESHGKYDDLIKTHQQKRASGELAASPADIKAVVAAAAAAKAGAPPATVTPPSTVDVKSAPAATGTGSKPTTPTNSAAAAASTATAPKSLTGSNIVPLSGAIPSMSLDAGAGKPIGAAPVPIAAASSATATAASGTTTHAPAHGHDTPMVLRAAPATHAVTVLHAAPQTEEEKKHAEAMKKRAELGLVWTNPPTLDFVTAMMDHFKGNQILDEDLVKEILTHVKPLIVKLKNVVHVPINTRVTVVGDIHGQLDDLYAIFKLNGLPSDRNVYLFNGDFVDRGRYSCECILVLLAFKLLYPDNFFLNRGNHEARDINSRDGFERECLSKYSVAVFDAFEDIFAYLPLAHVLADKVFVVHGGLLWDDVTLDQLQQIERVHEIPPPESMMEQMLWSDPDDAFGRSDSPRGCSLLFGPDVVDEFLAMNNLQLIVRSHECIKQGFEKMFNDKLITVFSASNYNGSVGNDGAYIVFEKNCEPHIVQYHAKPKERLTRYRMRHALLENDVISRLLQRISDNRLGLVDFYRTVEDSRGLISRQLWADGLKAVLKLDIPFLEFQEYLGLPKRGVQGDVKGAIDYMAFLLRFRPINVLLQRSNANAATGGVDLKARESLEHLVELLSKNRYELDSLFRHFDTNGDGVITISEFTEGVASLTALLHRDFSMNEIEQLVTLMDTNKDGVISYEEFFGSFEVLDPSLAAKQRAQKARQSEQRPPIPKKTGLSPPPAAGLTVSAAAAAAATATAAAPPAAAVKK